MLRSTRLLVLTLSVPALIAVGCTVKSVDTPNQVQTGSGGGTSTSSSSSSSTSSTSSTTSSSSSSTSSTSSSSGAGGGACAGDVGAGTPVDASCDTIPAASSPMTCGAGSNEPAPDMAICHLGFKIYTQGAAEVLATCINAIPVAASNCMDAEAGGPIQTCVQNMYAAACPNAQSDALCDQINTTCQGLNPAQAFDVAKCKGDLVPFSETGGLTPFNDCFNAASTDPCQTAYDNCFAQVTTAP